MIHIYTGSGKGKTTAATGLAVRAAGSGMRVCFIQFLKNGSSSEIAMLRKIGIDVRISEKCGKFSFHMTDDDRVTVTSAHNELLREAADIIASGSADMVVLDELFAAYNNSLLDRGLARSIVRSAGSTELVLTGRSPSRFFRSRADYISRIDAVKHPFSKGIRARKGIEY